MAKFKTGEPVYHKATERKGVIAKVRSIGNEIICLVTWGNGEQSRHSEGELYSEKEWEKYNKPKTM